MGRAHRRRARRRFPQKRGRPAVAAHPRLRQAHHHAGDDGQHQHAREQPHAAVLARGDGGRHARVHQARRVGAAHPLAQRAAEAHDARGQVPRDVPSRARERPGRRHPDLDGRPRAADGLRRRRRGRLAHGPVESPAGDGLLHAGLREPGAHRLPERRQAHARHGPEVHGPRHQAAGRGLRHEHDLERLQPREAGPAEAAPGVRLRHGRAQRAGVLPEAAGPPDVHAPPGRHVDGHRRRQVRDAPRVRGHRERGPRACRLRGHQQAPRRLRDDQLRAGEARRRDGQGHGPRDRDARRGARDPLHGPGAHHAHRRAAGPQGARVVAGLEHEAVRRSRARGRRLARDEADGGAPRLHVGAGDANRARRVRGVAVGALSRVIS
mmetsp:Transcript_13323/g.39677  ORF Transcript_13323/g.39677 Transcript_13323/m.39677 type:complete len:380 (-) Transcript_13323:7-1146(-)